MDELRYIGCDAEDIKVSPSKVDGKWVYVMVYHATMNPAAARQLAQRLLDMATQVELQGNQ